jgi:hypothetical protein
MPNLPKLFVVFAVVLLCARCVPAQTPAPATGAKPVVLQKNEGELRARRPREGVASPSSEFLLKIGPHTNGSKPLLVLTEEIPQAQPSQNTNIMGRMRSC